MVLIIRYCADKNIAASFYSKSRPGSVFQCNMVQIVSGSVGSIASLASQNTDVRESYHDSVMITAASLQN